MTDIKKDTNLEKMTEEIESKRKELTDKVYSKKKYPFWPQFGKRLQKTSGGK